MGSRWQAAVAGLAVLGLLGAAVAAQQEMLPKPGPGSGIMDVRGTVSISNVPEVTVTGMPPLTLSGPAFMRKGGSYRLTWPGQAEPESVTVLETGIGGGWVRVSHRGGARWVNLDAALAVEEVR